MSDYDLVKYYNATVVTNYRKGQKDQYELTKCMFSEPCKNIFLMQRSSSIVLNAEQDWAAEAIFIKYIMKALETCEHFYHIISLEGIENHFTRKSSVFPGFKDFANNLKDVNGYVQVRTQNREDANFYLKKLPKDEQNPLFKLDRQARILITESVSGTVNAVLVQNLGNDQTSFQIVGNKAKEYLLNCIEFYQKCEYVSWNEIVDLYNEYKNIELARGRSQS